MKGKEVINILNIAWLSKPCWWVVIIVCTIVSMLGRLHVQFPSVSILHSEYLKLLFVGPLTWQFSKIPGFCYDYFPLPSSIPHVSHASSSFLLYYIYLPCVLSMFSSCCCTTHLHHIPTLFPPHVFLTFASWYSVYILVDYSPVL